MTAAVALATPAILAAALLTAATVFAPVPAARALSFFPHPETFERDGVPLSRVVFEDGALEVRLRLPADWQITGTNASAVIRPVDRQAEATMTRVDGKQNPFDKAGQDAYVRSLLTGLPPNSTDAVEVTRADNPLAYGESPSFECVCAYDYFGRKFRSALIVMNHPRYQLRFTLVAPAEVFEALHREWKGSMGTMEWVGRSQSTH